MKTATACGYDHVQRAPLCLLPYGSALGCLGLGAAAGQSAALVMSAAMALVRALLGSMCHYLAISDRGEALEICFGPLRLLRRTRRYEEITHVEPGRTLIIDGWGVHRSIRGGWVWNLWGRDCVAVTTRRGMLRIGTDAPQELAAFLATRMGQGRNA
jgi:hypothetical protein